MLIIYSTSGYDKVLTSVQIIITLVLISDISYAIEHD